jgi:predicted DNA binding CopG/RHH family protein
MAQRREIEDLGEVLLDEETAQRANAMIRQADADIAARSGDVRVNFRWSREQVAVIKRAAAVHGVPYQTYLKQVVMRQALTDLKDAAASGT